MKYVSGRIVWDIYTWLGWSGEVAEPIGSSVTVRSHYFLLALPLPRSNPTRYKYPTQSFHWHTSFTCLWRWNRQRVPKLRQLELRRRGITQKGTNYSLIIVRKMFIFSFCFRCTCTELRQVWIMLTQWPRIVQYSNHTDLLLVTEHDVSTYTPAYIMSVYSHSCT